MARVVDHLVTTDDSEMQVMSMLRVDDLRGALVDEQALPGIDSDPLAGPFAHVVVDEAQELTDAEWQMVLARCPSHSLTIVGDRAQARRGFVESWSERLQRAGLDRVRLSTLSINYRTPREVLAEAEPVIRLAIPDANVPTSVRSTGVPVDHGDVRNLERVLSSWLEADTEGVACVIGAPEFQPRPAMRDRVRSLTPELCKGLEFDLVVLVNPDRFGAGIEGAVDRYVAMTRATQRLVVLTGR
jgi:DNA helicase IV